MCGVVGPNFGMDIRLPRPVRPCIVALMLEVCERGDPSETCMQLHPKRALHAFSVILVSMWQLMSGGAEVSKMLVFPTLSASYPCCTRVQILGCRPSGSTV
jgi:hypothetical protein